MTLAPGPERKTVRVPVRVRGGRLEFFYGGPFPKLLDGAVGDLVVDASAVLDPTTLEILTPGVSVPFVLAANC